MRKLTIVTALIAFIAAGLFADEPSIRFRNKEITVRGMPPGTKVAWLAMLRDRAVQRPRVTIERGLGPVMPRGGLPIDSARDASQSIWVIAAIDEDIVLRSSAPGYPTSPQPIEITARKGSDRISVRADSIHLMYVRRRGAGAWTFAAADGSELDGDGAQNGWITIPLESLQRFHGNPNAPEVVDAGDLILVIDALEMRSAAVEVDK